jgi:hypothetical protein|nr:MAG TPA: antitoxin [Caudoviricetes sp.]
MSDITAYQLRIDSQIMEQIKKLADEDGRSINKEIEYILKKYISSK